MEEILLNLSNNIPNMKLAIHHREESFSTRWISYCEREGIEYLLVDCFDTDIISKLLKHQVTHLMWHFNHASSRDLQVFPYVFNSVKNLNIKTYPNFETRWHFDDKIAQKYLLESIGAPLVKSTVFYNQAKARLYVDSARYPIVAKLRRGAGAANVELLNNRKEANEYIKKMFTSGRNPISGNLENLDQKLRIAKRIKNPIILLQKISKYLVKNRRERNITNLEIGYVYFQEFLSMNDFDTRIIVIGDIAFGIRRFNRKDDFRASGSGKLDFNASAIDTNMVSIAFDVSQKLKAQCLAYDFVYKDRQPQIIEVCFGFSMLAYDACEGYWDKDLNFIKGPFNPQDFMIREFIGNRNKEIPFN
ncbi:ATP-grasp domain-containing protein [Pontibacter sp. H249]|uniref:ATP-grasp domain-containing protein n=1 Tax=Pontibacter sp. H249 TaxID=3133420 RepID=UPI0030C19932